MYFWNHKDTQHGLLFATTTNADNIADVQHYNCTKQCVRYLWNAVH